MPSCLIALGGNLGPVEETFRGAIHRLDSHPHVCVSKISRVHRSAPVGTLAGGEFHNAAAATETDLGPLELLDLLQSIEAAHGRTRETRWGPRTLDLDLIVYGDETIESPRLRVPHPACWYRRFVLDPLVEIAADTVHPEKGISFGALRRRLLDRPLDVALAGGDDALREELRESLGREFPQVVLRSWPLEQRAADAEPALVVWLGSAGTGPGHQPGCDFESLPRVPRLDATGADDAAGFLRDVLHAALGE